MGFSSFVDLTNCLGVKVKFKLSHFLFWKFLTLFCFCWKNKSWHLPTNNWEVKTRKSKGILTIFNSGASVSQTLPCFWIWKQTNLRKILSFLLSISVHCIKSKWHEILDLTKRKYYDAYLKLSFVFNFYAQITSPELLFKLQREKFSHWFIWEHSSQNARALRLMMGE